MSLVDTQHTSRGADAPDRAGNSGRAAQTPGLALRFAMREMRGGLAGFYVFIACIALGVAAIVGVASLARTLNDGIDREGAAILGGDIAFGMIHRTASEPELDYLESLGPVSHISTLRSMARIVGTADGENDGAGAAGTRTLVEIKAVDDAYPLVGALELASGDRVSGKLAFSEGAWGGLADSALFARLGIAVQDEIAIGDITIRLVDEIVLEPDLLSGGPSLGPRLLIGREALDASGLVQPGGLVRSSYRILLDGGANKRRLDAVRAQAAQAFPDASWRITTRLNSSPGLRRSIDIFAHFLTLVGFTALIVGGVGVANAVRAFLDSKRSVVATLKCIGAAGPFVFTLYLCQILIIAGLGVGVGLALGLAIPFIGGAAIEAALPVSVNATIYPGELALGIVYGVLTALAFALWPLGKIHDVSPRDLFRADFSRLKRFPRKRYMAMATASVIGLAGLAYFLADDKRIAGIYILATAGAFALLLIIAQLAMAAARRVRGLRSSELRLAVANIHRPGALTPSVVLSLGLGLSLLVALALIDANLRRELSETIATQAPSFFFFDIQQSELARFIDSAQELSPGIETESVPMLRGRITALKGVASRDIDAPPSSAWALRGDRGITYSESLPQNSTIVEGTWWPSGYQGTPLVSVEEEVARDFGLKIGDSVSVNVLGRTIEATIANFREVKWESLAINFVLVFSPNTFAGAPHSHIATASWGEEKTTASELAFFNELLDRFPTIAGVRVKEAIEQINEIVARLALAIRSAALITLISSVLVLAGALAANHRSRIFDAVILKMLGATRARLVYAFVLEYTLLGLMSGVFAIFAGSLAAQFIVTEIMGGTFTILPGTAFSAIVIALVFTLSLGLAGSWRILGEKPAPILRNL